MTEMIKMNFNEYTKLLWKIQKYKIYILKSNTLVVTLAILHYCCIIQVINERMCLTGCQTSLQRLLS